MERHTVIYDGDCPLCGRAVQWLRRMDWGGRFALLPLADPEVLRLAPVTSQENLRQAMHCISTGGAVHRGAKAVRFIAARLPLLALPALLLWVPGVLAVAEWLYQWAARRRYAICRSGRCQSNASAR